MDRELIDLFLLCFPEENEHSAAFTFEHILKEAQPFIKKIGNKIVSILFLNDVSIIANGQYDIYYLYAACTHPDYRNRGLMHGLMEEAKNHAIKRNKKGILLKPANEGLFEFYKTAGFVPYFGYKSFEYTGKSCEHQYNKITEAEDYFAFKRRLLNFGFVELNPSLTTAMLRMYQVYAGGNSLAVYEKHEHHLEIKEWFGELDILDFVLQKEGMKKANVRTFASNNWFSCFWNNGLPEPPPLYHGIAFD